MWGCLIIKVLIVNTSDIQGGAARAAYRLHQSLLKTGLESNMLVQNKLSDDPTVIGPSNKAKKVKAMIRPHLDRLPIRRYRGKNKADFSPAWVSSSHLVDTITKIKPEIVHLHWVTDGMLRIEDLQKIKAPIIWSLHDMWPFTGGCHYDEHCGKYATQCGECPILGSKQKEDLSYSVFKRKQNTYARIKNLTIVGLSRWLQESAKQSALFKDKMVVNLPNPININFFKPLDKKIAREMLSIPTEKRIILFGAMSPTSDPRKGFMELSAALNLLDLGDVDLAIFGSGKPEAAPEFKFPVHYLGRFHDDLSLKVVYSAADVIVVPSLQENLSNVIMESMACGTPVVAFNIGGNMDLIDHKQNGYLAKPYESNDLANGIRYVLNDPAPEVILNNAVNKVKECFEEQGVALRYYQLYQEVISNFGFNRFKH